MNEPQVRPLQQGLLKALDEVRKLIEAGGVDGIAITVSLFDGKVGTIREGKLGPQLYTGCMENADRIKDAIFRPVSAVPTLVAATQIPGVPKQ